MVRPRPEKKPEPASPAARPTVRVLPMNLQIGDRISDETGEWGVLGRPFTTVGGKSANVRGRLIKQPTVTEIRVWGAHERISVKRAG
jgi:hypothetical protein